MSLFRQALMRGTGLVAAALTIQAVPAGAVEYDFGEVHASWVSQLTAGIGIRTQDPSCGRTGDPNTGGGGSAGCGSSANVAQWGNGASGNQNYKQWQPYTAYLKGTTELLLSGYDGYKFMARGTGLFDPGARATAFERLEDSARKKFSGDFQLLDLWASKDYTVADRRGRVRLGNQVVNWGESLFAAGGINATNAMDLQKLAIPGTQLKEAVIPSPMINLAQNIKPGLDVEAYYQFWWNHARFAPVGSYWSVSNNLGAGVRPIYLNPNNANLWAAPGTPGATVVNMGPDMEPQNKQGQFGINVHVKPAGTNLDLGFYFLNYHDKLPVLDNNVNGTVSPKYLENRQLYGVSANFPLGDWSIGSEVSYRPRDAVALTGCTNTTNPMDAHNGAIAGINCHQWKEMQKFQTDVVGMLAMTPSDYVFLDRIGASGASLTLEGTWIFYPGVDDSRQVTSVVGGQKVIQGYQAGYFPWLGNDPTGTFPIMGAKGTSHSAGVVVDYNVTYDGNVIPGWQVIPGATFSWSVYGYTPNFQANYMQGAKSINTYVNFVQNPATWQGGINFTHFFGGGVLSQPVGDRDFIGAYVTRNF